MNKEFKTILITGASSGIGAALALHYAMKGVTLLLTGRDKDRLAEITELCFAKGAQVESQVIDVTDQKPMLGWILSMEEDYSIDLVIANAGISGGTAGHDGTEAVNQARQIFNVNVTGVFNTIEPLLTRMIKRRSGHIAIMSSMASFSGWGSAPAYSASKAAVRFYGEALRTDLKKFNVNVSVICPGFIKTPMTAINPYKMPFMMDADKAANCIAKGLSRNKGRICFPFVMYAFAGFVGLLPFWLTEKIIRKAPGKPALQHK